MTTAAPLFMRMLGRVVRGLALLLGVLILLASAWLLYLASFDERLSPEVASWLARPPRTLPATGHQAFYTALGLRAKGDPAEEGLAAWIDAQRRVGTGDVATAPDHLPLPELPSCRAVSLCIAHLDALANRQQLLADHALLLQRYQRLHGADSISRPPLAEHSFDVLPLVLHLRVHRLWQLQQLQRWQQGETTAVLQAVAADTRLWLNSVRDATSLLDAVIASSIVLANHELLAWLQHKEASTRSRQTGLWQQALTVSPTQAMDLQLMLWGESRAFIQLLDKARESDKTDGSGPVVARSAADVLQKRNRTINSLYQRQQRLRQELRLAPAQLASLQPEHPPECKAGPQYLRNPVGTLLQCMAGDGHYHAVAWNLHKAEGLRRLLLVNSQMSDAHLPDGPVTVAMSLRSPWDGSLPQLAGGKLQFDWPCPQCKQRTLRLP